MEHLIPQVINVVVLVAVLVYFLRAPIRAAVKSRQEVIKKEVDEARALKAEAEKKYKEFSQKLASLESEAAAILSQAKNDAEAMKIKIMQNAKSAAERVIKDAEQATTMALSDTKAEIKKEVIEKAIALAEKMIREKVTSEDQRRMLNEYVGKVE